MRHFPNKKFLHHIFLCKEIMLVTIFTLITNWWLHKISLRATNGPGATLVDWWISCLHIHQFSCMSVWSSAFCVDEHKHGRSDLLLFPGTIMASNGAVLHHRSTVRHWIKDKRVRWRRQQTRGSGAALTQEVSPSASTAERTQNPEAQRSAPVKSVKPLWEKYLSGADWEGPRDKKQRGRMIIVCSLLCLCGLSVITAAAAKRDRSPLRAAH